MSKKEHSLRQANQQLVQGDNNKTKSKSNFNVTYGYDRGKENIDPNIPKSHFFVSNIDFESSEDDNIDLNNFNDNWYETIVVGESH